MARLIRNRTVEAVGLRVKRVVDWTVAQTVLGSLALARLLPAERATDLAERFGRRFAPILPRAKLARRNIALAFPAMSEAEVAETVRGVWGNVARTMAEYVFLDELFDFDPERPGEGRFDVEGIDNFLAIRDSGRPAIIFTGHTGNWEILPVAAGAYDLDVTALFRPPNNPYLAKHLLKARRTGSGALVPSRAGAAWALGGVLDGGGAVGVLVDQRFTKGPKVEFLGRETTGNPLVAKLARQFDCDVYPARSVRLPGGRFRLELHDRIDLPTDERGALDVAALTQKINDIVADWVREYPEQWLWLHDRWKKRAPARRA